MRAVWHPRFPAARKFIPAGQIAALPSRPALPNSRTPRKSWKSCGRNQIGKAGRHGADRDEIRGHVDGGHRADSHRRETRRARGRKRQRRSEEHTSELQSLMRISYAFFCLKKKHILSKNTQNTPSL